MFHLKIRNRDYILLITPEGKKVFHHPVRTMFLGIFSDCFTPVMECRSYLHLFTRFPLNCHHFWNTKISVFSVMKLSNCACNGETATDFLLATAQYQLPVTHVYSTMVSCPKWHVLGPDRQCWLCKYHGQRLFEQVVRDEFSKSTIALRNA